MVLKSLLAATVMVSALAALPAYPKEAQAIIDLDAAATKAGQTDFIGLVANNHVAKGKALDDPCDGTTSVWFPAITCDGGHIVALNFHGAPLANVNLPKSFSDLKKLTSFDFGSSGIKGLFDMGGLTDLVVLDISSNNLKGALPDASLKKLVNLESFDASFNKFSGALSPKLKNLVALTYLNVKGNKFAGKVSKDLSSLVALVEVDLSLNKFVGPIPSALESWTAVTKINVCNNDVSFKPLTKWVGSVTCSA